MFESIEYQYRVSKLQKSLRSSDIDCFIVRTDTNIMYLTGVDFYSEERKVLMLVPAQGEPTLIVPRMELERLSQSKITVDIKGLLGNGC